MAVMFKPLNTFQGTPPQLLRKRSDRFLKQFFHPEADLNYHIKHLFPRHSGRHPEAAQT